MLRRIARMGDGWLADLDPKALDKAKASFDQLYRYVEEVGRKREDVGINIVGADITDKRLDYEKLARNWRDLGVTHLDVGTIGAGLTTVQQHLDLIRRFKDAVG